jgi:hypothetical protein
MRAVMRAVLRGVLGRRFLVLTLAAGIAIAGQVARPVAQDLTQAAFDDLKHGGFVLVFRHGKTNPRERRRTSRRSI